MTVNYAEKEREFLEGLEDDTGRDLAAWMAAIDAQGFSHRNDIIDWLREQGFIFSWASWLERIHHNAGQPIYLDDFPGASSRARTEQAAPDCIDETPCEAVAGPARKQGKPFLRLVSSRPETEPQTETDATRPKIVATEDGGGKLKSDTDCSDAASELDRVFQKAKAYAPLARHLVAKLQSQMEGLAFEPARQHIVLKKPDAFAVLALFSSGLRLGLLLGDKPLESPLMPAQFPPPLQHLSRAFTHMILLNDARQVDDALFALIMAANASVNGSE